MFFGIHELKDCQRQGWTRENGEVEEDVFNHYCYFWHHLETREINIDGLEDDYDDFLFFYKVKLCCYHNSYWAVAFRSVISFNFDWILYIHGIGS